MITKFKNSHNMYRISRSMELVEVKNGIVLPRVECENGPKWGLGGVCDADNNFVKLSYYDGGWATHGGKYEWNNEKYIDTEVIYFGVYFQHWGHFLVDLIGRLWCYSSERYDVKNIKLAYIGEEEPKGNFLEFFELLGIPAENLIHITEPTRFKKVIVPEFSCKSCVWYSDEYKSIFDTMALRVKSESYSPDVLSGLEKVYLSRLSFGKARASEFGEDKIAEWFECNGFISFSPEKLTVRDQIYLWNNTKEIACLDGSIPLGLAFCNNKDLILTVLHKTSLEHLNLELFLLMRNCEVNLLDVWYEPFKGYPKNIGAGPFLLHLGEDAFEYSKQRGWLFPFDKKELLKLRNKNRIKLAWRIANLDVKLRVFISKVTPDFVKNIIRRA